MDHTLQCLSPHTVHTIFVCSALKSLLHPFIYDACIAKSTLLKSIIFGVSSRAKVFFFFLVYCIYFSFGAIKHLNNIFAASLKPVAVREKSTDCPGSNLVWVHVCM